LNVTLRRPVAACAFAVVVLASAGASAQTVPGFQVHRFEPSERGSEWFVGESLDMRGSFRPTVGVVGDYSYRPFTIQNADGTVDRSPVRNTVLAHVGASVVFLERFRLAASMPLQAFTDGNVWISGNQTLFPPVKNQGIGDLRLGADVRLFGAYGGAATGALGVQLYVPTGSRGQYLSDGEVRFRPRAMIAGDIDKFVYTAQVNFEYRGRTDVIGDGTIGSNVGAEASAGVRLFDRKLVIGPEIFGDTVLHNAFKKRTTPLELMLGAHYTIAKVVRVGVGGGVGLTRSFGSPEARALAAIEWTPSMHVDTDGDGIDDKEDACPTKPGVKTGDPKTNGCPPPPQDRDGDGVPDAEDACVDVPGVHSADPKTNGCPADADKDGVPDAQDACPQVFGTASPDPAKNGCPVVADTDGDGVFDNEDACPTVAGLKTSDPKTNGCPDPDRDKDGVPNDEDACPDEAGPRDPDPRKNGCPKAFVRGGEIKIIDQVKFKTNSAEIEKGKDSEDVLQAVLQVLNAHAEIKKLRVEGHTDDRGNAKLNKKLSLDRAASVVKWLTAHGVDAKRVSSAGFGSERPLESNGTEDGRRINRRVEFHIEPETK
jgi:outer membrane protein OmpA-like peptidoglycan-associated protein